MQGLYHLLKANVGCMVKDIDVRKGFQGSSSNSIHLDSTHSHKGMLVKLGNQGMLHGLKMILWSLGMIMEEVEVIVEEQGTIKDLKIEILMGRIKIHSKGNKEGKQGGQEQWSLNFQGSRVVILLLGYLEQFSILNIIKSMMLQR
jgi:hypothetical protein